MRVLDAEVLDGLAGVGVLALLGAELVEHFLVELVPEVVHLLDLQELELLVLLDPVFLDLLDLLVLGLELYSR